MQQRSVTKIAPISIPLFSNPGILSRKLTLSLLFIDILLIITFWRYAYVMKMGVADSIFFGEYYYSFVEFGLPETFGYLKQILLVAVLVAIARAAPEVRLGFCCLALAFLVALLDDAAGLHETIGRWAARTLDIPPVIGELVGFAMTGASIAALWLTAMISSRRYSMLRLCFPLSFFLAALIGVSVGVDFLHGLLGRHAGISQTVMTTIEDGGELILMTFLVGAALQIAESRKTWQLSAAG